MPPALLHEALAPLRSDPASAAVLLDIDGTLSPIVARAADATVPAQTRQLLSAVAKRYGLVACVTGRRAADARAMVALGSITYLGSHGAELLQAGWTESVLDPQVRDWTERIAAFRLGADTPELRRTRVRIEDKGPIVAFHWRGIVDEEAGRQAVDALAAQAAGAGLEVHWGRKVMEVRPPVRIGKGAGVTTLLSTSRIHAAVYVGDDVTDLDAFKGLRRLREQGSLEHVVCVGVAADDGPPEIESEADVVVDGPDGVTELLSGLTEP